MLSSSVLRYTCLAAAGALLLAGCGADSESEAGGDPAPVTDGASQVAVTLESTDAGEECTADHLEAAAGPVTFTVTNVDAAGITDVEILSGDRMLGEREGLAPGLPAATFTVTLDGGEYELFCPGAQTERQSFTVTGTADAASGEIASLLQEGADEYATYAADNLADLVGAVEVLQRAVDAGDLEGAKRAYADARPYYERVESAVEGFVRPGTPDEDNSGNLDYLIDMRESNLDPEVGWHGFHAIERDLWEGERITPQTEKYAADLVANSQELAELATTLEYRPEDLANGASGLLEEVQSGKITGEEQAYSHLDLVDISANVEGAGHAFTLLKPGLEQLDPELTARIDDQFSQLESTLDEFRDDEQIGGYQAWTPELRDEEAPALSRAVQALQEPLSRLAEKVATA